MTLTGLSVSTLWSTSHNVTYILVYAGRGKFPFLVLCAN